MQGRVSYFGLGPCAKRGPWITPNEEAKLGYFRCMSRLDCRPQSQGLSLLFALTMVLNAFGCQPTSHEQASVADARQPDLTMARDISCSELNALILGRPNLLIIDVRTHQEWEQGHIPGAGLIDFLEDDFDSKASALPTDRPIVLYCAAGGRSSDAMEQMKTAGFRELYNLRGGYYGWEDAGEAISQAPPIPLPQRGQ